MDKNYLHYRYVIIIMALAFISAFAYWFSGENKLVEIISFAGTLISIVLSLLAIFITVLSNDSMSSMMAKIRDLYEVIRDLPSSIQQAVSSLKTSTEQVKTNVEVLNFLIPELKSELSKVDKHLTENNETIKSLVTSQVSSLNTSVDNQEDKDFLKRFLDNSSFVGICLIYLIYFSGKCQKKVSLKAYCEKVDIASTLQYDFGYYIACMSVGIFGAILNIGNDEFMVSDINFTGKLSDSDIKKALEECSKNLNNPAYRADDYISKIENFVKNEC